MKEIRLPKDSEIAAMVPEYTARGDATRIVLCDGGEIVVDRSMRTVLQLLAARRCKTLGLVRAWAAQFTKRRSANPVAINADLVLVPLKARTPRVAGDNTLAAINVAHRVAVEDAEADALLRLKNGTALRVLWSPKTVRAHLHEGKRMQAEMAREETERVLKRIAKA